MTAIAKPTSISIDRARQILCRHILQLCEQGASTVRVRITTAGGVPQSAWFYGRIAGEWSKLEETVEGLEFVQQITEELERLAANPHSAECQVRRKEYRDRLDFEIKFHHDRVVAHSGRKLRSYLTGLLFNELHATPNERRQSIRRGPKAQVARF